MSLLAQKIRIGFFENQTQFFHISSIKIINDKNEDISTSCTYTSTSLWDGFSSSLIKNVLTDGNASTIMHTRNNANEQLQIEFPKSEFIKRIIVQNRGDPTTQDVLDRIIGAQIKIYNESNIELYASNKFTKSEKFFVVNPPNKDILNFHYAKKLRFGFFEGQKEFLHISSIRILNDKYLDITPYCTFSATSNYTNSDLKTVLTDQESPTFSHTNNGVNEYILIEFPETEAIVNVIVENRADATTQMYIIESMEHK